MNNLLEKCAEILVESGYADAYTNLNAGRANTPAYHVQWRTSDGGDIKGAESAQPLSDTLEGRRQADAIEDWLSRERTSLWLSAYRKVNRNLCDNKHDWRLDRIHWCIQELIK